MDEQTWIEDGTADAEPVTTETPEPAPEPVEAAPEPVEAAPEPVEAPEPAETPESVATEEPTEAEVTEAVEAGAQTEEEVRAFIEAKLGDEPYKVPEDVMLPLKRGKDVDYRPLSEVLQDGLRLNDYSRRMNELGEKERAAEARIAEYERQQRKIEEKEKYLQEREEEIKNALSDPESAAKYEQHLQMLRDNPMYRKAFERDWTARETEVELAQLQEDRDSRLVQEASTRALGWIESLAEEFPGVDSSRVASQYGQRLSAGQASLSVDSVRQIYRSEAEYIQGATKPLQDQLAELAAKIDTLSGEKAAEKHNETTAHAVKRAKTTPVTTGSGAPAKTPTKPTKFGPNELPDRNQAWIDAG